MVLFRGSKWESSKAHLELLSRFIHPISKEDFLETDYWKDPLGEEPTKAIKRFLKKGLLQEASLPDLLDHEFKTSDLKNMLKDRGLKATGRKPDLITRLIEADRNAMQESVSGIVLVKCSERGRQMVEEFLECGKAERERVEQHVMDALLNRDFRQASESVATFEAEQIFPRGMGVDWSDYDCDRDIATLGIIFNAQPKILGSLKDTQFEHLRIAAASSLLWGTDTKKWLPQSLESHPRFDNATAARMILFYARTRIELDEFEEFGIRKVEVSTVGGCEECQKLSGRIYEISKAPELPNEKCTFELGCRCMYLQA